MFRKFSTSKEGSGFNEQWIQAVWEKGAVAPGYDSRFVRKDACGVLIERSKYGETSLYGWEIDHMIPVALGGPDSLQNLQPLQWQNNRHKSDNYPQWSCALRA